MADAALLDDALDLEGEARLFASTLTGAAPADYVVTQYLRAHDHLPLQPTDRADEVLLHYAAQGPLAVRAADGYARLLAPRSVLRRKLSVMLAILESSAPGDDVFASRDEGRATVLVRLVLLGLGFAALLGVALVTLAPLHLAARLGER